MDFTVLKPFTWDGKDLKTGETVSIASEHPRVWTMAKAKYITKKESGGAKPRGNGQKSVAPPPVQPAPGSLPKQPGLESPPPAHTEPSPREVVAQAKARAEQVKVASAKSA